jgi:hypothetical protein
MLVTVEAVAAVGVALASRDADVIEALQVVGALG